MSAPRVPCDFCRVSLRTPTQANGWSACTKQRCQGKLKCCVEQGILKPGTAPEEGPNEAPVLPHRCSACQGALDRDERERGICDSCRSGATRPAGEHGLRVVPDPEADRIVAVRGVCSDPRKPASHYDPGATVRGALVPDPTYGIKRPRKTRRGRPGTFGPAYDEEKDGERIEHQRLEILAYMLAADAWDEDRVDPDNDGRDGYRTLEEISMATQHPEGSVSAQLRHLRKEEFGGWEVQKRRRDNYAARWEYRVVPK